VNRAARSVTVAEVASRGKPALQKKPLGIKLIILFQEEPGESPVPSWPEGLTALTLLDHSFCFR